MFPALMVSIKRRTMALMHAVIAILSILVWREHKTYQRPAPGG
jgi:hypothetical protein